MPRHWRCAHGHAWTGELGALTYCPDCGSPDVYEVRPQYESASVKPVAADDASNRTIVQPALGKPAAPVGIGDSYVQAPIQPAGIGDTFVQAPIRPANVTDTLVQPLMAAVGDTLVQPAEQGTTVRQKFVDNKDGATLVQNVDPGTTNEQIYVPEDAVTLVQTPVYRARPTDDGAEEQTPAVQEPSTLDLPAYGNVAPTLDQPVVRATTPDGPTVLAPKAGSNVTRAFPGGLADGGSIPPTPADTPTLDAPPRDGASHRTADYPSTVASPGPGGARSPGISGQDTRQSPALPAKGREPRSTTPPVDGYEILSVLGRGGMGVVYKARQVKLNRIVALKMILAGGHAGAYERQRFATEMEAVAHLQHPNIVQIYETGERDGLPYFTLEFCDGGSLQQKLGGQPMPPKVAADVAEQLSLAMQYAHERGIVHRDLKPANILFAGEEAAAGKDRATPSKDSRAATKDGKSKDSKVSRDAGKDSSQAKFGDAKSAHSFSSSRGGKSTGSLHGPRALPKVTDFGLAKRFEEDSGLTGSGTILGTPSYMAPEQAEGRTRAVGPPADIHALGAILYEMLTGRPPFLGENVVETMNQVRTMEPVPPTRIQPKTPKDLETVCLKCLQKEMHKRYASAGDLASDLRRFLDGEPIAARPVPVWEKGWKWAKRRPAQAALIGLSTAVVFGLVGSIVAFAQYQGKRAAEETALKDKAVAEARRANTEFQRAESNFKSAREAVDQLLVRVGGEKLERVPKAEKLRNDLLTESLGFYKRFLETNSDDPSLRREAAWAYQRFAHVQNDLGDKKMAIATYGKAIDLFDSLSREATDRQTDDKLELAQSRRQLAVVLEATNQVAEADKVYKAARDGLRELADSHADQSNYRLQLGELLVDRGGQFYNRRQLAEAEDCFRQALAEYEVLCRNEPRVENRFRLARAQANIGAVVLVAERIDQATKELTSAVAGLEQVVKEAPDNPEFVKELGQTEYNLATAYFKGGKNNAAGRTYQQAIARLDKLATDFPNVDIYRFALGIAYDNFAVFLKTTGGLAAAEPERAKARAIFDDLRRTVPENLDYRRRYALDVDEHAIYLAEQGRLAEAIAEEKIAVELLAEIAAADPRNPEIGRLVREAAVRHLNLGQLYARNRQSDEAEAEYGLAVSLLQGPADRRLRGDESWYVLPTVYINQAKLFQELDRGKAAERSLRDAVAVSQRIKGASPQQPDAIAGVALAQASLAGLQSLKPAEMLALAKEAVKSQRAALALAPKRADLVVNMGLFGARLITLLADEGDHAAAADAAATLSREIPEWRGWPLVAAQLARCVRLARTDKALSDEQKTKRSTEYGEQALDLLRKAVANGFKNEAAIKESPELEVLRTDPAFREAFEKVLSSMKP